MNATQYTQMLEMRALRLQGLSYPQIALQLHTTRYVVYNRLRRNGSVMLLGQYSVPRICEWCGIVFNGRVTAKYCSDKHRKRAWRFNGGAT